MGAHSASQRHVTVVFIYAECVGLSFALFLDLGMH